MLLVESTIGITADRTRIQAPANEDSPQSSPDRGALVTSYYEIRDRIIRERDAGNIPEALKLCDKALELATQTGDEALIDQAYCNRCGFALVLERPDVSLSRLREILMRSHAAGIKYAAAYTLAGVHSTKKHYKKALFYAQIAHHHAYSLGEVEVMVESHNEIGRYYLAECYYDKATAEYETALGLLPDEMSYAHLAPMLNLGYARLVQKDYRRGFDLLYRSLRHCRSHPSERAHQEWIHLFLCFGHIELRRWRYAWHHGCSALELAQGNGNKDAEKYSLYLLGDLEKSVGDIEAARGYFLKLQREFYPEDKEITKFMLSCDTRELVNLRA